MRNRQSEDAMREMLRLLERIEASLVVRDPGNARSVEAFEGLRKQLANASRARRTHVSHLITLATDIEKGANLETISNRLFDFLRETGVRRSEDTDVPGAFRIDGEGPHVEVREPAWLDILEDGTVVVLREGSASRIAETREAHTELSVENETSGDSE